MAGVPDAWMVAVDRIDEPMDGSRQGGGGWGLTLRAR